MPTPTAALKIALPSTEEGQPTVAQVDDESCADDPVAPERRARHPAGRVVRQGGDAHADPERPPRVFRTVEGENDVGGSLGCSRLEAPDERRGSPWAGANRRGVPHGCPGRLEPRRLQRPRLLHPEHRVSRRCERLTGRSCCRPEAHARSTASAGRGERRQGRSRRDGRNGRAEQEPTCPRPPHPVKRGLLLERVRGRATMNRVARTSCSVSFTDLASSKGSAAGGAPAM